MYQHITNLKFFIPRQKNLKTEPNQTKQTEAQCGRIFAKIPRNNYRAVKHKEQKLSPSTTVEKAKLMMISSMKLISLSLHSPPKPPKNQKAMIANSVKSEAISCIKQIKAINKHKRYLEIQKARSQLKDRNRKQTIATFSNSQNNIQQFSTSTSDAPSTFVINKSILKDKIQISLKGPQNRHLFDNKINKSALIGSFDQLKNIESESYVLMQYPSKKLIIAHRSRVKNEIASLTKMMTFFVIMKILHQYNLDPTQITIIISSHCTKIIGTTADLCQGEQYTIQALLYAMMLPSGNDAASELACWGGSIISEQAKRKAKIKVFVDQMNKMCESLGMYSTLFCNPHGLSHAHARSTSLDIALLCSFCLEYELFRKIVSCKKYTAFATLEEKPIQKTWKNTNKLLHIKGFIGLKTGTTITAGPCLASAYKFRNQIYIAIILKAPNPKRRFAQTCHLISSSLMRYIKDLTSLEKGTLDTLKLIGETFSHDSSEDQEQQLRSTNKSTFIPKSTVVKNYNFKFT